MAQSHYNFKRIQIVSGSTALIDVVLSKTQRKTPTEIHRHYAITRIRDFYTRKVKFAQQSFHDKLTRIVEDFPHFDSLHPSTPTCSTYCTTATITSSPWDSWRTRVPSLMVLRGTMCGCSSMVTRCTGASS